MGQVFGLVRVKQSEVAVREHCGKFNGVLQPGCHCVPWYSGCTVAGLLSLRVQQFWFNCKAKTKDDVYVKMETYVQFRPSPEQVEDAFYKLNNVGEQMIPYVCNFVSETIAKMDLNTVFEETKAVAKAVHADLQKAMFGYGYKC